MLKSIPHGTVAVRSSQGFSPESHDEIALYDERRHLAADLLREAATHVLVHHTKQEALPLFERAIQLHDEADPETRGRPGAIESRKLTYYNDCRLDCRFITAKYDI